MDSSNDEDEGDDEDGESSNAYKSFAVSSFKSAIAGGMAQRQEEMQQDEVSRQSTFGSLRKSVPKSTFAKMNSGLRSLNMAIYILHPLEEDLDTANPLDHFVLLFML